MAGSCRWFDLSFLKETAPIEGRLDSFEDVQPMAPVVTSDGDGQRTSRDSQFLGGTYPFFEKPRALIGS